MASSTSVFLSNIKNQLLMNGKLLMGYVVSQVPGLTSFPGLTTAFKTALADRTPAAYADLAVQVVLAAAALHRTSKIVNNAVKGKAISY